MDWNRIGTVFAFVLITVSFGKRAVEYNGFTLYRVHADTKDKLDFLETISEQKDDLEVDFWDFPSSLDEYAEVLVSPKEKDNFQKELREREITFSVIHEDIQRAIDEELVVEEKLPKSKKRLLKDGSAFDVNKYNTWEDIDAYLRKLPQNYPSLVSVRIIGASHEGRELVVVKVGNEKVGKKKPAIWMDSAIHAREWIAPATTLYILDTILYSYQSSQNVKRYLDELDWYFLPVMNPDGYVHTFTKDRMWRKNRSTNNCTVGKKCCNGVDLNRNFGYQWGGSGASSSRCSNTYAGTAAFTEPESKAVRDFVLQNANRIKAFLTFHSYAQSWRHPYAYKRNTFPEDIEDLRGLAQTAVQNLRSVHNVRYKVSSGGKSLSGVSRDWAKGEAKIKYVYCVELASRGSGFVTPTRAIVPSGEENWAALKMVAEKIIEKYVTESSTTTNETIQTTPNTSLDTSTTSQASFAFTDTTIIATSMPNNVVGNRSITLSTCDDLSQDCAKKFDHNRCHVDIVVRIICKRYCGAC